MSQNKRVWAHGDKAWAYVLTMDESGWPDMAWSFPPTYGLLTATLRPETLETIEQNVAAGNPRPAPRFFVPIFEDGPDWDAAGNPRPAPRFFVPIFEDGPDWDAPRILGTNVSQTRLFENRKNAAIAYNGEIMRAVATAEGTVRRLKQLLVDTNVPAANDGSTS